MPIPPIRHWLAHLRASRPLRVLLLIGGLSVAVLLVATIHYIGSMRDRELEGAERELSTLNLSLAEQTASATQSVDLVLTTIIEQLKADGVDTPEEYVRRMGGRDTHQMLRARITGLPQLDAVTMIAADGHLINFSRYYPIPAVNVSDRDYFAYLRDHDTTDPYISEPVQNRGNGSWTVYLARRISGRDGRFVGLVLGAIELSYFQRIYQALQPDGDGSISLWRRDGLLLARHPVLPDIGRPLGQRQFLKVLERSRSGVYLSTGGLNDGARLVATQALADYPLVVNVTRKLDAVLKEWRIQAWTIGAAGTVGVAALLLSLWALARQFSAYEAATRAMDAARRAVEGREQAEHALRQSQKMEAIGQLTGGVAHDFNNLLQAIGINLHVIDSRTDDERISGPARLALQAVERGATLTQHLLAFSRRQQLRPVPVDVATLVERTSRLLGRTLGQSVRIETEVAPGLWPAMIDPTQLEMAVLNLALNARDAMPGGGTLWILAGNRTVGAGPLPMQVEGLDAGDYVVLRVRDTGTGMPADVAARAFEPFFTTKEVGRGTGLGLSMVHGLATQSGGGVELDSRPGLGTTVTLYLPRALQEADAPAAPPPPPVAKETAGDAVAMGAGCAVLLVDDEELVRSATAGYLEQAGFAVREAADAAAALSLLDHGFRPDVIVTDHMMPGMTGLDMARTLRARHDETPILMVTGYAEDLTSTAAAQEVALTVLSKPVEPSRLVRSIRDMAAVEG
ncbi:signal transduction histidine kinase/ActR/RegA family two-component response regulator [Azospirillum lipoferum]|nr:MULTISPECIES: hybrid sensor histidine kinase/response regulator [Azospirillum]MCP1610557.1 signal transduction histidine kinase/ActR/RegA family two-component response regulator [Azospirillum lipoferum]MDW5538000.1 response regulator [Azospirillum sp. NL1]